MFLIHWTFAILLSPLVSAGPLEDLSTMPDLSLFYQQLIRQQDLQMILQGMYPQQQFAGLNELTIFAPNNEAMQRITLRMEDPSLLFKYHVVAGRYDDRTLYNMAQEKLNQFNGGQFASGNIQNNLPTVAMPFQVFYGLGFHGGTGPNVNETSENAGYGSGGISWLTHTSFNQTISADNRLPVNPFMRQQQGPIARRHFDESQGQFNEFNRNSQQFVNGPSPGNANFMPSNFSQNQNVDPRFSQKQYFPQGGNQFSSWGVNNNIGILLPTINNAFILQSRPMSRGVINVIDQILWPPERRDQNQIRSAFDVLEEPQFSRLRQLADRSEYFRSELRSNSHKTWFLPNDQAFASMGSTLSYLLDQSSINNTNEINEFIQAHVLPMVVYPSAMDSTKRIPSLLNNRWITFRKVTQPDQSFQVDVVSGRFIGRILVSRPEDIRITGNGVVYPISSILSAATRSAADELTRGFQYFMNLVQQSGDLELINILQGMTNPNVFNSQTLFNITVLVPQQTSIQQLGNSQELSINLRRHIIRYPVYVEELRQNPVISQPYLQQNFYHRQQQSQSPTSFQLKPTFDNQQPNSNMHQQQQQVQPNFNNQQQQTNFNGQQIQSGFNVQQSQTNFMQPGFINQRQENQYQGGQFQKVVTDSYTQIPRKRRQSNTNVNSNLQKQQFMSQQYPSQQQFPNQQQLPTQQFANQQQLSPQQFPNQQQLPTQQFPNPQLFPNQQQLPSQSFPNQPQIPTQQFPNQQQFLNQQQPVPNQYPGQQQPDPSIFAMGNYPQPMVFQNGQVYPTMDPQFSVQAQTNVGPNGPVVTLVGRSSNGPSFTATIINSESNIPIRNGVIHVIRGLLAGTVVPIESVLPSIQGASTFGQLLQQSGILDQLRGRPHTLFVPTNAALQSMGISSSPNQLRQFLLRHICADVLLDPINNIIRRSAGFYNQERGIQRMPSRFRQKRQEWMNMRRNETGFMNTQAMRNPQNFGQSYLSSQQQQQQQQTLYGSYQPANSPQYGQQNQMYGSMNEMNRFGQGNPGFVPNFNATFIPRQQFGNVMPQATWNSSMNNPSMQRQGGFGMSQFTINPSNNAYMSGPQSCTSMSGERITVQSLRGTQPEGNAPSMNYQNYIVTCCGDQSINSMVQSYNVYPPNVAVYLIGRPLLSHGQSISNLYNRQSRENPCQLLIVVLLISILFNGVKNN